MTTAIQLSPGLRGGPNLLGPLGMRLTEDGELIKQAFFEIGKSWRGVERCMEHSPYLAASIFSDKLDFLAAPACNLAFARAVERIASIDVPARAELIRGVLLELTRISSHLFHFAQLAQMIGAHTVANFCLRERERVCDVFEMYCGSRLGFHSIRIGGVAENVTEGLLYRIENVLGELESFLIELEALLMTNSIFRKRMKGLAVLSPDLILELGISGPNARASGVDVDLRRERPGLVFQNLQVEPMRDRDLTGDAFSRLEVRIWELGQSSVLIRDMLTRVPSGNYRIPIGDGFVTPPGDAFEEVESPRGRLGAFVLSDGGPQPIRVSFACPSLASLAALPQLLEGEIINDAELILASFDISLSEVDK